MLFAFRFSQIPLKMHTVHEHGAIPFSIFLYSPCLQCSRNWTRDTHFSFAFDDSHTNSTSDHIFSLQFPSSALPQPNAHFWSIFNSRILCAERRTEKKWKEKFQVIANAPQIEWNTRLMRARCNSINVKSKTEHWKFNGRRPFPFSAEFIDYLHRKKKCVRRVRFHYPSVCVSMAMRTTLASSWKRVGNFPTVSFCWFFPSRGACAVSTMPCTTQPYTSHANK